MTPLGKVLTCLHEGGEKVLGMGGVQLGFGMPLDAEEEFTVGGFNGFHDAIRCPRHYSQSLPQVAMA